MTPTDSDAQDGVTSDPAPRRLSRRADMAVVTGLSLLAVLFLLVAMNHATARTAYGLADLRRPAGVPADAVLCDGAEGAYYVSLKREDLVLADGRRLPAFLVGVWDSRAGMAAFAGTGIFVLDHGAGGRDHTPALSLPSEAEILKTARFDGRELRFDIVGQKARGRIIALDIPQGRP